MSLVKPKRVSAYTKLAVRAYRQAARHIRKAEELTAELEMWLSKVPDEDLDYYVEKTNEIQRHEDEKLEKYISRLGKKPWER